MAGNSKTITFLTALSVGTLVGVLFAAAGEGLNPIFADERRAVRRKARELRERSEDLRKHESDSLDVAMEVAREGHFRAVIAMAREPSSSATAAAQLPAVG